MNRDVKKDKPFPWRRYVVLIILLVFTVRTVWRWPRTGWSLDDTHQNSVVKGPAAFSAKDVRNIILISLDTTRASHLGCYGYSRKTSPNVDALAADGVLFNHAIAPVPLTLPSHSTTMTGTTPYYHNVHDNDNYRLNASNVTLAEIFRENGFVTGGIVASYVLRAETGINQGFDSYDDLQKLQRGDVGERNAEEVTKRGIAWLEKNHKKRFFLFLHYFDPHWMYLPHDKPFSFTALPQITTDKDLYDGEIAYMDYYVGRVIDKLKHLGIYDDALIVVAGDHGESLGDHIELKHGFFTYHSTIHVPLIFKLPKSAARGRVNPVVGLVDIMPTVCSLLNLEAPDYVQGEDLTAYFQNKTPANQDRALYSESFLAMEEYGAAPIRTLVTNQYKYIHVPRPELYDLLNDRYETCNSVDNDLEIVKKLRGRMMEIIKQSDTNLADNKIKLDPESIRRLQSLGYTGGNIRTGSDSRDGNEDPKDLIVFHESARELFIMVDEKQYGKAKELAVKLMEQRADFYPPFMERLAWILATHPDENQRDPETARILAEHGAEISQYKDATILSGLAAAHASAGHFAQAVKLAETALELSREGEDETLTMGIQKLLALYRQKQCYFEPPSTTSF